MAFLKSRIYNTQQFVRQTIEPNRNGERFCLILGSGAFVASCIPSGNALGNAAMAEADKITADAL